jgi:hypothetical protein
MLDIKWDDGQIVALFKRNDQGVDGARNGECVGYIDPRDYNGKFDLHEFNGMAFCPVILKRTEIPNLRASIVANIDSRTSKTATRAVFDFDKLSVADKSKIASPDLMQPVDMTKASSLFKSVTIPTAKELLAEDVRAIASGVTTYGDGQPYALRSAMYADAVQQTGNLKATRMSATTENASCALSWDPAGYLFEDDGNNLAGTLSLNGDYVVFTSTGTPGTIKLHRHLILRDATALTGTRYITRLNTTTAHTVKLYDKRIDGGGVANSRGLIIQTADPIVLIRNNVWKRLVYGWVMSTNQNAASRYENVIFCTSSAYAISNGTNFTNTYRNAVFLASTTGNILNPTNSTAVNCATDVAAVGAGTDTAPQVSLAVADEFVNTDITDLVNGYRLKSATSTKLKSNGAAPANADNTVDLFSRPRPGTGDSYSIGVSELYEEISGKDSNRGSGPFRGGSYRGGAFRGGAFR